MAFRTLTTIADSWRWRNQIIFWIPSLVVIDVGPLQEVSWWALLKHSTSWITCNPFFTLAMDKKYFFLNKNVDGKWERHQWRILREDFGRGRISRRHKYLKNNRISPADGLMSNKDEIFINKSCFVFLLYQGICWFCAIFERFGGDGRFWPHGSAFEDHGSPPSGLYVYVHTYRI